MFKRFPNRSIRDSVEWNGTTSISATALDAGGNVLTGQGVTQIYTVRPDGTGLRTIHTSIADKALLR